MRDRTTMTEPPPRVNFKSNATQWEIYDAYQEDFEAQQKNKETKKTTKVAEKKVKKTNQSEQVRIF
jgi:dynein intermediate chain 1